MYNYKTANEKALEWHVSSQHVKYLCRGGKIKGAVKRAGAWFIPDDAPNPVRYTKSGSADFRFVGTKNKIFNSAIELFMIRGFNDVSLKDIADHVGVNQSSIYNHFESKQEILDTIYDFYCHCYLEGRPSLEEMELVLQNGSVMDIIRRIRYDFKEEYKQKLSDISIIIFQRIAIDERAREISKSLIIDEGVKYVEQVFERGIEIGRFAPFDTHTMAAFINSVRIFTFYHWIVDPSPDSMKLLLDDEQALYQYSTKFLADLKAPVINDSLIEGSSECVQGQTGGSSKKGDSIGDGR